MPVRKQFLIVLNVKYHARVVYFSIGFRKLFKKCRIVFETFLKVDNQNVLRASLISSVGKSN